MEEFLTAEQLAKKFGVSRVWIYRLVAQKRIPFFRLGGKVVRFSPSEIERWLENGRYQEYNRDKMRDGFRISLRRLPRSNQLPIVSM